MKLAGKNVLVTGAARSGYSAVKLLSENRATAYLYDKDFNKAESLSRLKLVPKDVTAIKKVNKKFLRGIDFVVVSPGVPMTEKPVKLARKLGIEVIGELELGYQMLKCPLYAVTGTNGKTTVTELLGQIFKRANYKTHVVGNVGTPITSVMAQVQKSDISICEVSSFQLETIKDFHAYGIGITNITPDHLDRHGHMENYIKAKFNIFKNSTKTDFVLLNADDDLVRGFGEKLNLRVYYFSLEREVQGVFVKDGTAVFCEGKKHTPLFDAAQLKIKGAHNLANVMLAAGMAYLAGIAPGVISETVSSFPGVPHRLEFVRKLNEADYYNDSKATNPNSTIVAVRAFSGPVILLLGGSDKGSDFNGLFKVLPLNVRACLVYGQTKRKLVQAARANGFLAVEEAANLESAVKRAKEIAKAGDTVLLSPACASFDSFRNYEHRGEAFKTIVGEL